MSGDRLKPGKTDLSYADLHHEITKAAEESNSKLSDNLHMKRAVRQAREEDEVVKYMSILPGYLERGQKIHERVLNVGVLDWRRLEKWQNSQKNAENRTSRYSSASTSSYTSPDLSSRHSNRGHSCSPTRQRFHDASLKTHFMGSYMQGHSKEVKSSEILTTKQQDKEQNLNNSLNGHRNSVCTSEFLHRNVTEKKDSCPKVISGPQSFADVKSCSVASSSNLGMVTHSSEFDKRTERAQKLDKDAVSRDMQTKSKPIVLLLPRNLQNNGVGVPLKSDSRTFSGRKSENVHRAQNHKMYSVEGSKEVMLKKPGNDLPLSRSWEINNTHSRSEESNYRHVELRKCSAGTFSAQPRAKLVTSPSKSRSRIVEERKSTMSTNLRANESASGLRQTENKVTSEKLRSYSPFRRFNIGSSMSKNSGSKESVAQASSSVPSCSGSQSEIPSASLDGSDKSGARIKGRSSPLRRLLDPLLKVRTTNCRQSAESSKRDALSICRDSKSADANSPQSGKEKSSMVTRNGVEINDSSKEKVHATSTVQALLQIARKNGLPLFTFAVDNHSEILAATVKLNNSRKNGCTHVYTFFTFQEVKRKNGSWMIQGGKSKGPDYSPHVVAQMKVSESQSFDVAGQDSPHSSKIKEFVLFSVKLRQGDDRCSDYQPNDELAAIVVRVPQKIDSVSFDHHKNYFSDVQEPIGMTVVLPSGVHTLPSRGGPSSLIERWKSGGSCDCGGWDLGCKLKILDYENHVRTADTSNAHVKNHHKLYLEGIGNENQPAFSLSPFKHGIYSIAFDSPLSLLQAFSICIALMDRCELSGSSSCGEEDAVKETILVQTHGKSKVEGDVAGSYVSIPPLSPVGRV